LEHTFDLVGAKWICRGVDEADFYEAIASFNGVKGLEKIAEKNQRYNLPIPLKVTSNHRS
jgi:hypothetical protein